MVIENALQLNISNQQGYSCSLVLPLFSLFSNAIVRIMEYMVKTSQFDNSQELKTILRSILGVWLGMSFGLRSSLSPIIFFFFQIFLST